MTGAGDVEDVEAAVREHARRVVAGDPRVREDLAADARLSPPDLVDRLLEQRLRGFELVAHAKIGAHHLFKTRYAGEGRTIVVVQARWARLGGEAWQLREAEVTRSTGG